ncbi:MAG: Lrp/AsnC family transcriptional regulator [Desulfovibrionaceae bacterium]
MKEILDAQDRKLVSILAEDGQLPVGQVAERMGVTAPTVRSRLKNLVQAGVMRVAGLIDPFRTEGVTVAMVAITLQSHEQLDSKLDEIAQLDKVHWAAVVTGRYDIMVEIVLPDSIADLYRFINEDLSRVGGISTSESFVVMKGKRKWVLLPDSAREWFK